MRVYKTDIVRKVAKETRVSQRVVSEVLDTTLATIKLALRQDDSVTLPGFGTFLTRQRGERTVRQIRSGEPITIPAGRQAAFRAGELLKRAVGLPARRRRRSGVTASAENAA